LNGGENITGAHSFDMVNFDMFEKCTLVKHTLILENSKCRTGHAANSVHKPIYSYDRKIDAFNGNLRGNFLFVFVTFLAVVKLPNTCKMLWIKGPYVAVAMGRKPPSHYSS